MQMIAREMNLSETAFLLMEEDGFSLQWFTQVTEVDLCGHATLASAHVLWQRGYLEQTEPARFFTKSGTLSAVKKNDWIEMDFPAEPEHAAPDLQGLLRLVHIISLNMGGMIRLRYASDGHVDQLRCLIPARPPFKEVILPCSLPLGGW